VNRLEGRGASIKGPQDGKKQENRMAEGIPRRKFMARSPGVLLFFVQDGGTRRVLLPIRARPSWKAGCERSTRPVWCGGRRPRNHWGFFRPYPIPGHSNGNRKVGRAVLSAPEEENEWSAAA